MTHYYKLDENKNAIPCSIDEWAKCREKMFKSNVKRVSESMINGKWISTVWIGIDHQYHDKGQPQIFETMIFEDDGRGHEIYCDRYSTWKEAEEGHLKAIEWVKNECKDE